jgi:hypothetical protein
MLKNGSREEIAPEIPEEPDFYLDELGRTVFTRSFHLKRGHCCGNGCKHCPYPLPDPLMQSIIIKS